ncbi:MAG: hypothetical protein ACE5OO_07095 [Candidatus Bathyarchaeia archaeon]
METLKKAYTKVADGFRSEPRQFDTWTGTPQAEEDRLARFHRQKAERHQVERAFERNVDRRYVDPIKALLRKAPVRAWSRDDFKKAQGLLRGAMGDPRSRRRFIMQVNTETLYRQILEWLILNIEI